MTHLNTLGSPSGEDLMEGHEFSLQISVTYMQQNHIYVLVVMVV